MSQPAVVWMLNAIAVVVLALPFLFMQAVAAHGWMGEGAMMRIGPVGVIWVTLAVAVVTALVVAVFWARPRVDQGRGGNAHAQLAELGGRR